MPEQRPLPEATDAAEKKCLADVKKTGWHIVHVLEDDDTPGWSFTVGLARELGHPELLVFGIPREIAHDVLNVIAVRVKLGRSFPAGGAISDVLEGFDLAVRNVEPGWYEPFLGLAVWFHQGVEFPVVQLFWPDKEGRYPWSPGVDEGFLGEQPQLFEADAEKAHATALLDSLEE